MHTEAGFGSGRWQGSIRCRYHGAGTTWLDLEFSGGIVCGSGDSVTRCHGTYDASRGTCVLVIDRPNGSREEWSGALDRDSLWGTWRDVISKRYANTLCSGVFRLTAPRMQAEPSAAEETEAAADIQDGLTSAEGEV